MCSRITQCLCYMQSRIQGTLQLPLSEILKSTLLLPLPQFPLFAPSEHSSLRRGKTLSVSLRSSVAVGLSPLELLSLIRPLPVIPPSLPSFLPSSAMSAYLHVGRPSNNGTLPN